MIVGADQHHGPGLASVSARQQSADVEQGAIADGRFPGRVPARDGVVLEPGLDVLGDPGASPDIGEIQRDEGAPEQIMEAKLPTGVVVQEAVGRPVADLDGRLGSEMP